MQIDSLPYFGIYECSIYGAWVYCGLFIFGANYNPTVVTLAAIYLRNKLPSQGTEYA